MKAYQHILLAADFSPQSGTVARKAGELAKLYQARLSIIHVLDSIPMPDISYGTVIPLDDDTGDDHLEAEKNSLIQIADELKIEIENCWLVWGNPQEEVIQFTKTHQVDLIVTGSHGRHGLALLLGSTANSILHHADCDVMAVYLEND